MAITTYKPNTAASDSIPLPPSYCACGILWGFEEKNCDQLNAAMEVEYADSDKEQAKCAILNLQKVVSDHEREDIILKEDCISFVNIISYTTPILNPQIIRTIIPDKELQYIRPICILRDELTNFQCYYYN